MEAVVADEIDSKRTSRGWWHYWLTLQLPAEVSERLLLPAQAGCVASFLAREGMEDTLIRWMQRICSTQHQWMVTLDPVVLAPGGQLCWQVRDPTHFHLLQEQLRSLNSYLQGSNCPALQLGQPVQWKVSDSRPFNQIGSIQFLLQGMILFRRACYAEEGKQITLFGLRP
jgi:hypothetical protein